MLLRADAHVLREVLAPLVPSDSLGPVIDRLLASASEPDAVESARRDFEAYGAIMNGLLERAVWGGQPVSTLQESIADKESAEILGSISSMVPEVLGAQVLSVVSPTHEGFQGAKEQIFDEFRHRAARLGWQPPAQGERGIIIDWPADVTRSDVQEWLKEAPDQRVAERVRDAIVAGAPHDWRWPASHLRTALQRIPQGEPDPIGALCDVNHLLALVSLTAQACSAFRRMQDDRGKNFLALDASSTHHRLICGLRDLPKGREACDFEGSDGWIEILPPNDQIGLKVQEHDLSEKLVETIRRWRGWIGLRHWAALHRLLTIEGRKGEIRWTLDAHLDAFGYRERARRDHTVRRNVAEEVRAFTQLELAVYHPNGALRLCGPLFSIVQRAEARRDAEWEVEGLVLAIHPLLYEGVRRPNKTLGSHWAPAPADLARMDHVRHPHALALGLILPLRWRWDLAQGRDCVTLTGRRLLEAAGLDPESSKPSRSWDALERDLAALADIDGVGKVVWEPGRERTLSGRCHLFPPQWVRDRMVHRVEPIETPPPPSILTGRELRAWRKSKDWTQQQMAEQLGVGVRTIRRSESEPHETLSRSISLALSRSGRA